MSSFPSQRLQIDEDGYWVSQGLRLQDDDYGRELSENLKRDEGGRFFTQDGDVPVAVEAFDEPLVVRLVEREGPHLIGHFPYQRKERLQISTFSVDEWDRFHGRLDNHVPYVLARAAQAALFDLLDSFDDESLTFQGVRHLIPPWLEPFAESNPSQFWDERYTTNTTGWELGRESVILPSILPQLKLSRCRIAVLGCGSGHDAAFLARAGHMVTGIDYSLEAISRAKKNHADIKDLQFIQGDVFSLPASLNAQFDVVFEHTCYCAVNPERRNELVQVWRRLLSERGHLLAVFFVMDKRRGPPWGGSEWEIRERLKRSFHFRYWTRWSQSIEKRQGTELVIWAEKS